MIKVNAGVKMAVITSWGRIFLLHSPPTLFSPFTSSPAQADILEKIFFLICTCRTTAYRCLNRAFRHKRIIFVRNISRQYIEGRLRTHVCEWVSEWAVGLTPCSLPRLQAISRTRFHCFVAHTRAAVADPPVKFTSWVIYNVMTLTVSRTSRGFDCVSTALYC